MLCMGTVCKLMRAISRCPFVFKSIQPPPPVFVIPFAFPAEAHGYTRAQLADPNVIKRYQCSCAKCLGKGDAGSNKLVDPKTFFKHQAKTSEPAPEVCSTF